MLNTYVGEFIGEEDENSIIHLSLGENYLIFNSTYNHWDMLLYSNSKITFIGKKSRIDLGFKFI